MDNWSDKASFACVTCQWWVRKEGRIGRCRHRSPTLGGWPVTYDTDWCGSHKLGTPPKPQTPNTPT